MALAAARALCISEIVVEIVEHVGTEPLPERSRMLARVAQVSQIFRDPAVRLLWTELPSLEPLLDLASNCVRVTTPPHAANDGEVGTNIALDSPPVPLAVSISHVLSESIRAYFETHRCIIVLSTISYFLFSRSANALL